MLAALTLLLAPALAADLDLELVAHEGELVSITLPDADTATAPTLLLPCADGSEARFTLVELAPEGDAWRMEFLVEDVVQRRGKQRLELLANPTLVARAGQQAEFMMGWDEPVATGDAVEFREHHTVLIRAMVR